MAIGDDAAAAGMELVPSAGTGESGKVKFGWREINKTRDYIAQKITAVMATVWGISRGGTGATTAAGARAALSVVANDGAGQLAIGYIGGGRIRAEIPGYMFPTTLAHLSDITSVDISGKYDKSGGTISGDVGVTGNVFIPNSGAGGPGVIAYHQTSDGRITRGVSARRYKKNIRALDPDALGDLAQPLAEWQMRVAHDRSGYRFVGHIADDMIGTPAERFVIYDANGDVEGYDQVQYLLALTAQQSVRLAKLEERHDAQ